MLYGQTYICTIVQQELCTGGVAPETSLVERRDPVHGEGVDVEALRAEGISLSHVLPARVRRSYTGRRVYLTEEHPEVEQSALVRRFVERSSVRPDICNTRTHARHTHDSLRDKGASGPS